jgi:hypothetical protein
MVDSNRWICMIDDMYEISRNIICVIHNMYEISRNII